MANEDKECWKALLDVFYDFETLEVRPSCDELFDDLLSMQLAICARLAQTGHEKEALRLWNHIAMKQDSSKSSEHVHPTSENTEPAGLKTDSTVIPNKHINSAGAPSHNSK